MKKCLLFLLTLIICCSFAFPVLAATYGNDFPSYVPVSGGAYIEVESSVGTATLVFPSQYQNGYFGFAGRSGSNVCNIYGGTISGYLYTASGQTYSVRSSYGNLIEWRSNSYPYDYTDLNITSIKNTNISLIDLSGDRENTVLDFSPFQIIVVCLLLFLLLLKLHNHTKIG